MCNAYAYVVSINIYMCMQIYTLYYGCIQVYKQQDIDACMDIAYAMDLNGLYDPLRTSPNPNSE